MRAWMPLILAFFAAVALAQNLNNHINIPAGQTTLQASAGQSTTITWSNPSSGTVTIKLQQAPNITPDSGYVLASGILASALTASFTIPATVNSHQYTIEIIDDTNPSNYYFSPSFGIQGATGTQTGLVATDTASASISSASSASASLASASLALASSASSASSSASASSASASKSSPSASSSSAASSSASTSSTTSPPSSSTTAASPTHTEIHNSGLSTGAKAGVGVGAAVGALLILAALLFFCLRRRRTSRSRATPTMEEPSSPWGRNELAISEPRRELEGSEVNRPRLIFARTPAAQGVVELE